VDRATAEHGRVDPSGEPAACGIKSGIEGRPVSYVRTDPFSDCVELWGCSIVVCRDVSPMEFSLR
jgi:hypothetical protein